jgi:hypothetical protein
MANKAGRSVSSRPSVSVQLLAPTVVTRAPQRRACFFRTVTAPSEPSARPRRPGVLLPCRGARSQASTARPCLNRHLSVTLGEPLVLPRYHYRSVSAVARQNSARRRREQPRAAAASFRLPLLVHRRVG